MNEFKSGTVEGTGAAINISLGWQPDYVKVWNIDGEVPASIEWVKALNSSGTEVGMGDAGGWKTVDGVEALYTLAIDAGSDADGDKDAIEVGDLVVEKDASTEVASGATGVVVHVPAATSGTWAGDDWLGSIVIKDFSGTAFTENDKIFVGDQQMALVAAAGEVIYDGSTGLAPTASTDKLSSNGITPYDGSAQTAAVGFTIGADTDVNISGDTLMYIAMR